LLSDYDNTIDVLIRNGARIYDIGKIKDILIDKHFYIEEGMMDYFVHVNPELINISLATDPYSTIAFLNKNRVLMKPEDREEFKKLLRDIDYVVTPSDLNVPLMYHDALRVSLENDEMVTLSTRVWHTLDAIINDDDLYVEYMARLEKNLTSKCDDEDSYYIDEMMYALNFDASLLFECLSTREGAINFLDNLNRCPINIKLDDIESLELFNMLRDMKYSITNKKEHPHLLERNINFLLASLENDYDGTVEFLKDRHSKGDISFLNEVAKENISDAEYNRYKQILIKNNFLAKGKDPFYLYLDHNALMVLSEIDVNKALMVMGLLYEPPLVIPARSGAIILKNILDRINEIDKNYIFDDLYFRLMPSIEMVAKRSKSGASKQEANYVIEAFNKGILSMSFISSSYFGNDEVMSKLDINEDVKKILKKMSSKFYKYNRDDEDTLLKILNKNSLQEVIMPLEEKKRKDLSIEEVVAIELFGIKTLQENDLNYRLDLFGYSDDYDELGGENNEEYYIELYNGHNRTVYEMIKTIYHEVNHAIQFRHVSEANFYEDEDIIEYAKDEILKAKFMNYYEDNYNSISFEYDTDMKAKILTDALFGDFYVSEDYLTYIHLQSNYSKSRLRNLNTRSYSVKNAYLDVLFDKVISSLNIDEEFLKKYKCLTYEYNFNEKRVRRYTISELVEIITSSIDEEEKKKYLVVLKHSLDPRRNSNYKENRDELLKLDSEGKLPQYLAHDINLYNPIIASKKECLKYFNYLDENFDRIKKLLSKKHRKSKINK